ncbi:SYT4 [Symbiodinium sp. CCMP2592]|nr:SYT4 [Symbiodinium sp. CCMP2592]
MLAQSIGVIMLWLAGWSLADVASNLEAIFNNNGTLKTKEEAKNAGVPPKFYVDYSLIVVSLRMSFEPTVHVQGIGVVRSLHGLSSGVSGHAATTSLSYILVLGRAEEKSKELGMLGLLTKKMITLAFVAPGIPIKPGTESLVATIDRLVFCGFHLSVWKEAEDYLGEKLQYANVTGALAGTPALFPSHEADRAVNGTEYEMAHQVSFVLKKKDVDTKSVHLKLTSKEIDEKLQLPILENLSPDLLTPLQLKLKDGTMIICRLRLMSLDER